ncbi:7-carboxy-7-deazaguanine synthase QueE [Lyticum sinuosum]|uniref:7-carboxy-7-deazaguanine synthase n=1 Tax=Lyticum sinuosum TaxID=1332059 RepID=A0AAE5AGN7_9RICK|nr:7-carboxy-7-deazaguanine synthase QueE [Lyticum sinuosum]MDZ5760982.1 7-carboxy-7-deazaguanine synthase [Lyticum sinuosum]
MFGKNKKLKQEITNGQILKVKKIFGTLQAEGPYTGYSAVFIRLSGCNLSCDFCDTEFEDYELIEILEIYELIKKKFSDWYNKFDLSEKLDEKYNLNNLPKLIVITGGEPFRQNIGPLCELLLKYQHIVQIESNGTLYYDIPKNTEIVCSPKINSGCYWPINSKLVNNIIAFKFLICSKKNYIEIKEKANQLNQIYYYSDLKILKKGLEIYKKQVPNSKIYFQPIDENNSLKNKENINATIKAVTEFNGILSLQIHKLLEIE